MPLNFANAGGTVDPNISRVLQPKPFTGSTVQGPSQVGTGVAASVKSSMDASLAQQRRNQQMIDAQHAGQAMGGGGAGGGYGSAPAVMPSAVDTQGPASMAMASFGGGGAGGGATQTPPAEGDALRMLGRRMYPQESQALAAMGRVY